VDGPGTSAEDVVVADAHAVAKVSAKASDRDTYGAAARRAPLFTAVMTVSSEGTVGLGWLLDGVITTAVARI
jgi:hypothetical protein